MPPIPVLHFRNGRGISTLTGPETYLLYLFSRVEKAAVDLSLLWLTGPGAPKPVFLAELTRWSVSQPVVSANIASRFSVGDVRLLAAMVRRQRARILHTHDARSTVVGALVGRGLGVPTIAFAHGWPNWSRLVSKERLYASLEALALRLARYVIVASRAMERELVSKGIPAGRIRWIPYGIDTDRFHPNAAGQPIRQEWEIPRDAPLIGMVGRFHPWKGHRYFLEAARRVADALPEARFLVVGDVCSLQDEQYKKAILELGAALGLRDRVVFAGTRTDIPEIMAALDVFVLPSVREPFGIVLLEAQACGTPVVAFSVDGTPEALQHLEGGWLIGPPDRERLADAILAVVRDPDGARAMGVAGRRWVEKEFSVDAMVRRTEALYREADGRR